MKLTPSEAFTRTVELMDLVKKGGSWLGRTRTWIQSNIRNGDRMIWQDPNERVEMRGDQMHELMCVAAAAALIEHMPTGSTLSADQFVAWVEMMNEKDDNEPMTLRQSLAAACEFYKQDAALANSDPGTLAIINMSYSNHTGTEHKVFLNQDEFDADELSAKGYEREMAQGHYRQKGYPIERYDRMPLQFPCLMINTGAIERNANGPDEQVVIYFYNFKDVA